MKEMRWGWDSSIGGGSLDEWPYRLDRYTEHFSFFYSDIEDGKKIDVADLFIFFLGRSWSTFLSLSEKFDSIKLKIDLWAIKSRCGLTWWKSEGVAGLWHADFNGNLLLSVAFGNAATTRQERHSEQCQEICVRDKQRRSPEEIWWSSASLVIRVGEKVLRQVQQKTGLIIVELTKAGKR